MPKPALLTRTSTAEAPPLDLRGELAPAARGAEIGGDGGRGHIDAPSPAGRRGPQRGLGARGQDHVVAVSGEALGKVHANAHRSAGDERRLSVAASCIRHGGLLPIVVGRGCSRTECRTPDGPASTADRQQAYGGKPLGSAARVREGPTEWTEPARRDAWWNAERTASPTSPAVSRSVTRTPTRKTPRPAHSCRIGRANRARGGGSLVGLGPEKPCFARLGVISSPLESQDSS